MACINDNDLRRLLAPRLDIVDRAHDVGDREKQQLAGAFVARHGAVPQQLHMLLSSTIAANWAMMSVTVLSKVVPSRVEGAVRRPWNGLGSSLRIFLN